MKKSEKTFETADRYEIVEKVADKLGRIIGVRKLKPSEQLKVEEMSPGLSGENKIITEDGKEFAIPRRAPLALAASVCQIDGIPVTFARSRAELDAILDRLDTEGLDAAFEAQARLFKDEDASKDPVKEAKN